MMYAMPVEVDSSTFSNLLLKYLKIKYMAGLYEYIYKQLFGDHCKLRVSVRVIKCIIDFTFDDLLPTQAEIYVNCIIHFKTSCLKCEC